MGCGNSTPTGDADETGDVTRRIASNSNVPPLVLRGLFPYVARVGGFPSCSFFFFFFFFFFAAFLFLGAFSCDLRVLMIWGLKNRAAAAFKAMVVQLVVQTWFYGVFFFSMWILCHFLSRRVASKAHLGVVHTEVLLGFVACVWFRNEREWYRARWKRVLLFLRYPCSVVPLEPGQTCIHRPQACHRSLHLPKSVGGGKCSEVGYPPFFFFFFFFYCG